MKKFPIRLVFGFLIGLLAVATIITAKSVFKAPSPEVVEGQVPVLTQVDANYQHNQVSVGIPESVKSCLPENFDAASLFAQTTKEGTQLFHLLVTAGDDTSQPLIQVREGQCQVLNPRIDSSDVSLTSVIDPDIAKELAIQRYQKTFEQVGGKEEFQRLFLEEVEGDEVIEMPLENYDALKALGIDIPENVHPLKALETGE